MAPTLIASSQQLPSPSQADRIVVNKRTYRFTNPDRGDIVVYNSQVALGDGQTAIYVHRVIGLPGETIDIEQPYILVNGQKLIDPPIFKKISSCQDGFSGYFSAEDIGFQGIEFPVILGENEYFLLGDNSEFSADSRMHGPVNRSDILGRVTHIYYPFSRIGKLE